MMTPSLPCSWRRPTKRRGWPANGGIGAREAVIEKEISSAHRKWPSRGKVVELRPGQQARPDVKEDPAPEFMGFPLNDLGNSMRMLGLYGQDMRYCVSAGWFLWDKRRFRYDPEGNRARRLAQATAVRMRLEAAKLPVASPALEKRAAAIFKYAIGSGNKKGINGMLSEAKPSDKHAITVADLDANPMLLNCRNGTVDLKTGAFRSHSRDDLISKMAGADYDPAAACPQWEKFVSEIFNGKSEVIAFVQRALGYSLTGDCREEVIFILHGAGANGKTVLIETMAAAMGDYVSTRRPTHGQPATNRRRRTISPPWLGRGLCRWWKPSTANNWRKPRSNKRRAAIK